MKKLRAQPANRQQWNTRIRPEFKHAVEGVQWKSGYTNDFLAQLGIAVLLGLDKKNADVSRHRSKIMSIAEEIGVAKDIPLDDFKQQA